MRALQVKGKLRAAKVKLEQLKSGPVNVQADVATTTITLPPQTRYEHADLPQDSQTSAAVHFEDKVQFHAAPPQQALRSGSLQIQSRSSPAAYPGGMAMSRACFLDLTDQDDYSLCIVCMEAAPQVKFQPCAHSVTCWPCGHKILLQTGECPMCRCTLSALDTL